MRKGEIVQAGTPEALYDIVNAYKRIKGKNLKQKYHEGDVIEFSFSGEDVFVFPEPEDFKKELNLG